MKVKNTIAKKTTVAFFLVIFGVFEFQPVRANMEQPVYQTPKLNSRIHYRSSAGAYLGESVNRNGVTTHYDSKGRVVFIDRCSGSRCFRYLPNGQLVTTWNIR